MPRRGHGPLHAPGVRTRVIGFHGAKGPLGAFPAEAVYPAVHDRPRYPAAGRGQRGLFSPDVFLRIIDLVRTEIPGITSEPSTDGVDLAVDRARGKMVPGRRHRASRLPR